MGCYINPKDETKEQWLGREGEPTDKPIFTSGEKYLVCLIDNSVFSAAGVAYNSIELDAFTNPDDWRPKRWFYVPYEKLKEVSPIQLYTQRSD